MSHIKQWLAEAKANFKVGFLRWTPAVALVFGVVNIIGLSAAHAYFRHDVGYLLIGVGGLVLLGIGLWPVRSFIPYMFGSTNEKRRT